MENVSHQSLAKHETKTKLLAGIVTGQIAGLIMAVVMMIVFTLFLGRNPLYPVQVIGSALLGGDALVGINITAILAGLVIHQLGPSLLWGALFGYLATQFNITTSKSSLFLGLGIAIFSMVVPLLIIPMLMKTLHGVDYWNQEVPMFWDWAAHLVFGISFVLFPAVKRKLHC